MATGNDRQLMAAEREVQTLATRIKRMKDENKQAIEATVGAVLVTGGAFGFAFVEGRFPDRAQVGGLPISLIAGGLGTTLAAMGELPEEKYLGPLAQGALACYGALKGYKMGQEAKTKADAKA